jgi:hypothetical protein
MIGFRFRVGCDWITYNYLLRQMSIVQFSDILTWGKGDPFYTLLNWAANTAGFTIWFVNLGCAIVFVWGLASLARTQPNPQLAMLVATPYLAIVVAMGYTRQGAALGCVMYAISQIERSSYVKISVALLAAAAFHKSAIVVMPFFMIALVRGASLGLIVPVVAGIFGYKFFLQDSVDSLMHSYVDRGYGSVGALPRLLMNVPPALLCLFYLKRFRFDRGSRIFWIATSLAAIFVLVAFYYSPSSTAVDRIALYLIPLQVVILARMPSAFGTPTEQNKSFVIGVVAYSLLIELVWLVFSKYGYCWVPYRIFPPTLLLAN